MNFNIVLVPCGDIITMSSILQPDIPAATQTVINTSLGAKFKEEGVIDK